MVKKKEEECFIIMPIGDADGYAKGHFSHVYKNIIQPSCEMAGYKSVRGDEVKETNLIHLDILKKLIEAPLAICDLSNRNPNVLFELGIRQAFDKPTVLIQEQGTPKIFDITPLRYLEYSSEMKYHDVLSMQEKLKNSIVATAAAVDDPTNVNSIVKLLALNHPAQIPDLENGKESLSLGVLQAEMKSMRQLIERKMSVGDKSKNADFLMEMECERALTSLGRLVSNNNDLDEKEKITEFKLLVGAAERLIHRSQNPKEERLSRHLLERVYMAEKDIFG